MPQLDVSTFAPQLVWLAITFVLLYVLMAKVGLPRVGAAITARRQRLDDDLAQAAQLNAQAEAALAAYEKALSEARAGAQATIRETAARMAAEAGERHRELTATLAQQIDAAERRIKAAQQQALSDIRRIAIEVASAVAERLSGSGADQMTVATAVDHALAERAL